MTANLPAAYPSHPHASEEARKIAQDGMIFRTLVGSEVHGISLGSMTPGPGDDRDEMGLCIEPPEYVVGLRRFEQFERHTAWDRPGGVRERSGAGDLDVTVYGLRKFCRLALDGNPSILTLLFVPQDAIVQNSLYGMQLLQRADAFVSLKACDRYLGYLRSQRNGIDGTGRTNRPELVEKYGFDTKFASHALRLGVQGIELMTTGRINLPMVPGWRDYLLEVRRGQVAHRDVVDHVRALEDKLLRIRDAGQVDGRSIPEFPDRDRIDRWLYRTYLDFWEDHFPL